MSYNPKKFPSLSTLDILCIFMISTPIKYNYKLTIRTSDEMEDMIKYIESKTLLNKTAIIRYALAELYKAEKMKEEKVNGDIYG